MTTTHLVFDNEKIDELQTLLDTLGTEETCDLGLMDGVFTALALLKTPAPDEEVLPYLFSSEGKAEAMPDNTRLLKLMGLRRAVVHAALQAGHGFEPIILHELDDNGEVVFNEKDLSALAPWCTGFFMGLFLSAKNGIPADDEDVALLRKLAVYVPADAFDFTEEDSETLQSFWQSLQSDMEPAGSLEGALQTIVATVYRIKSRWNPNEPVRNTTPRVGRNDPCPCGSGKKYKQCCGKK